MQPEEELIPQLIIDDPISSLDLNYELNATQRIVEIARERKCDCIHSEFRC